MPSKEIGSLGHYEGKAVAEFLDDGRLVQLKQPFAYVDPFTMRWDVPSGWKVDGASIPKPLWSIVDSPFVGKYRKASIIHDYYCDTRERPWGAVHRVFYDAMLTSKVHPLRAKVMYAAVRWGGPRWESISLVCELQKTKTVGNWTDLPLDQPIASQGRPPPTSGGGELVYHYPFDIDDLRWLENELKAVDVSDQNVPDFVDEQIKARRLRPDKPMAEFVEMLRGH